MPAGTRVVVGVMAPDMRHAHPRHEARQVAIPLGPQHQVPVIGHQTIPQQIHRHAGLSLREDAHERVVVRRLVKQPLPAVPAVQTMIDHSAPRGSALPWHHGGVYTVAIEIAKWVVAPFPRSSKSQNGWWPLFLVPFPRWWPLFLVG